MYHLPIKMKCSKCGHEQKVGQDDPHPSPRIGEIITCPKCWEAWLKDNIGAMEPS